MAILLISPTYCFIIYTSSSCRYNSSQIFFRWSIVIIVYACSVAVIGKENGIDMKSSNFDQGHCVHFHTNTLGNV